VPIKCVGFHPDFWKQDPRGCFDGCARHWDHVQVLAWESGKTDPRRERTIMAVRVWAWRTRGWHQQGAKMGGHGVGETQVETVLDKNPTCTQWMSMLGQDNVGLAGISSRCKIPSKRARSSKNRVTHFRRCHLGLLRHAFDFLRSLW